MGAGSIEEVGGLLELWIVPADPSWLEVERLEVDSHFLCSTSESELEFADLRGRKSHFFSVLVGAPIYLTVHTRT